MGYKIRNWADFQHYKDRNPPWIKLHFSLLSSEDWVMWDDASRALAIACMLLASRSDDGIISADPAYIKRVAYLHNLPDFKPLIECGFLYNASSLLANCKHVASTIQADARSETEERHITEERQRAQQAEPKKTNGAHRGTRLLADWGLELEDGKWAETTYKLTPSMVMNLEAQFRDYWIAQPGQKGVKLDWPATWRNWVRRSQEGMR